MKNIIIRWSIFFICLFVVYFVVNAKVHAIAQANLQSAMVVNLPQYTKQELIDDATARMKYMLTRTKGIKFFIHKVKRRENLWQIAKQHGYSVHTVIGCNPQMKTYDVYINQNLLMPSIGGNLHPVSPTDTWQSIAEKYLSQAVVDNIADYGTVIIMQPSTGNILAMANYPDYNPFTKFTIK